VNETCTLCHQPILGGHLVTEGPSKGNPGIKFFHPGCVKHHSERMGLEYVTSAPAWGLAPPEAGRG
jgi:hypothetical protein